MIEEFFLIIGLGNPGKNYEKTRHNIGFRVVKALATKYGIVFRPSLVRAKGNLGKGEIEDKAVLLLLPLTYMNESGLSVKRSTEFYKISLDHILVVVDDVALPFGSMRLRLKGSCGGHKGLCSIEKQLHSMEYPRLRIGVGDKKEQEELAHHVLGCFTQGEEEELPHIISRAIHGIMLWLKEGGEIAMREINI